MGSIPRWVGDEHINNHPHHSSTSYWIIHPTLRGHFCCTNWRSARLLLKEIIMTSFILGTIFGIVIATVGLNGIVNVADKGVMQVETMAKDASK